MERREFVKQIFRRLSSADIQRDGKGVIIKSDFVNSIVRAPVSDVSTARYRTNYNLVKLKNLAAIGRTVHMVDRVPRKSLHKWANELSDRLKSLEYENMKIDIASEIYNNSSLVYFLKGDSDGAEKICISQLRLLAEYYSRSESIDCLVLALQPLINISRLKVKNRDYENAVEMYNQIGGYTSDVNLSEIYSFLPKVSVRSILASSAIASQVVRNILYTELTKVYALNYEPNRFFEYFKTLEFGSVYSIAEIGALEVKSRWLFRLEEMDEALAVLDHAIAHSGVKDYIALLTLRELYGCLIDNQEFNIDLLADIFSSSQVRWENSGDLNLLIFACELFQAMGIDDVVRDVQNNIVDLALALGDECTLIRFLGAAGSGLEDDSKKIYGEGLDLFKDLLMFEKLYCCPCL